jgi:hypothetical protein
MTLRQRALFSGDFALFSDGPGPNGRASRRYGVCFVTNMLLAIPPRARKGLVLSRVALFKKQSRIDMLEQPMGRYSLCTDESRQHRRTASQVRESAPWNS